MSDIKNDGGPAFPSLTELSSQSSNSPCDYRAYGEGGMSLRDWFSAQPLNETELQLLRTAYWAVYPEKEAVSLQALRFFHADKMLSERNK